jgi:hypothetical protein
MTRRLLYGFLTAAALLGLSAEMAMDKHVRKDVMAEVEAEAKKDKMPTGFKEAKWLMSPEELIRVRPAAQKSNETTYTEMDEYSGRKAKIVYVFEADNSSLIYILVNFMEGSSPASYEASRKKLIAAFGEFPPAGPDGKFEKQATLSKGRTSIGHNYMTTQGVGVEQIMFYRNKG